jgi:hypothetical protein
LIELLSELQKRESRITLVLKGTLAPQHVTPSNTISLKARLRSYYAPPPSLFVRAYPLSVTSLKIPILVNLRL